jgi:hypothetical protein
MSAKVYRYRIVIEGDDYSLMESLFDVAQAALDTPDSRHAAPVRERCGGIVEWTTRDDEDMLP